MADIKASSCFCKFHKLSIDDLYSLEVTLQRSHSTSNAHSYRLIHLVRLIIPKVSCFSAFKDCKTIVVKVKLLNPEHRKTLF